jgi:hypothetical protein
MNEQDISGLIFTVSSGTGGGGFQMVEDEFYPATLTDIKKVELPNSKYGPTLNWTFSLEGEDFSYEKDGVKKQFSIKGSTSLIFSSNPTRPSKLFTWYCKLTGTTPAEGEKITLGALIGKKVAVSVKITKSKDAQGVENTWYNVEKVKAVGAPVAQKKVAAPKLVQTLSVKNPGGVTDPSEIPDDIITSKTQGAEVESDLYKDVF